MSKETPPTFVELLDPCNVTLRFRSHSWILKDWKGLIYGKDCHGSPIAHEIVDTMKHRKTMFFDNNFFLASIFVDRVRCPPHGRSVGARTTGNSGGARADSIR